MGEITATTANGGPPRPPTGRAGGTLRRAVSWRSSVVLAVGAGLQITAVMGAMVGELGNAHLLVWSGMALVGLLQCFLIAELAGFAPDRAGGVAGYAQPAFGRRAPLVAALAGWGYWFAWTPGIAVHVILAAEYLRMTVLPGVNPLLLGLALAVMLYSVNSLGLRHLARFSAILLGLAGVLLLTLLLAPVLEPSLFSVDRVWPPRMPDAAPDGALPTTALLIKWMFVAIWSAYAAELAASVVAEMRQAARTVMRAMVTAGVLCLAVFTLVPAVMTGIVGVDGLSDSPTTVFLAPAEVVFGDAGRLVVGVMLAGALLLGAQAYIIASSRALYQMSRDAYLPRALTRLNRHGVPYRSVVLDACVISLLLILFGTSVVDVVAAAVMGYLVVFVLIPTSFVVIRIRRRRRGEPVGLPRVWTGVGVAIAGFNLVLLVVGAAQWGVKVWLTGVIILAMIVPLMRWRRWRDRVAARRTPAADSARPSPGPESGPALESGPVPEVGPEERRAPLGAGESS